MTAGTAPTDLRRTPLRVPEQVSDALQRIAASPRIVLYCGQGANDAAESVRELAELLCAPVITTFSARGLLPEDHPLSIVFNSDRGSVKTLNRLFERSDLVLALGCKLSNEPASGLAMRIATEKLVRVDASQEIKGSDYPATTGIRGTVEDFVSDILRQRDVLARRTVGWEPDEVQRWRHDIPAEAAAAIAGPRFPDVVPPTAAGFFAALREAMPREACLVTDSGRHQVLARVHFRALSPRGLIVPSGFQSMGFGLPAAIGAKLADPHRPVVALIGDGGFAMSAMELLSAVRHKIPLTVIVFNDGVLGQIRLEQINAYGIEYGTSLLNPDFEQFAAAVGVKYFRLGCDAVDILRRAIHSGGVSLVEVRLRESFSSHVRRVEALARKTGRRILGPELVRKLRLWLG